VTRRTQSCSIDASRIPGWPVQIGVSSTLSHEIWRLYFAESHIRSIGRNWGDFVSESIRGRTASADGNRCYSTHTPSRTRIALRCATRGSRTHRSLRASASVQRWFPPFAGRPRPLLGRGLARSETGGHCCSRNLSAAVAAIAATRCLGHRLLDPSLWNFWQQTHVARSRRRT